jgi:hypothetical protein
MGTFLNPWATVDHALLGAYNNKKDSMSLFR